ncbi:hypothetical protein C2S53_005948 [Perilla frutescens var. hirtella]|uniref:VQ domain-containing protein n=1 Tax=Perilla frutescens var. hirtella TaxID=608512 RepID=A0AAD4P427_PERFH|nr:hypothetical protein C2S51_021669 [Perilla frutescens var. frutescens]KAH6825461.1 hypothetical protein C2S53_005948 [Perilla frutescens var. hirtella]
MNPPEFFSGSGDAADNRPSPRKELQLQGPRPTALKVNKDSHKIKKPPVAPLPHHLPPPPAPPQPSENRQPIIIYAVPPRVIHTTVSDYKSLVQRLTGNNAEGGAAASSSSGVGDLSPAARLASIEKTSPPKEREAAANGGADSEFGSLAMGDFLGDTNVELGAVPGILSPAPWSLPPISPGFFSPAGDPFMMGLNSMFLPSPSTLFTAPMVSPSPSSCDLFNPFFDF